METHVSGLNQPVLQLSKCSPPLDKKQLALISDYFFSVKLLHQMTAQNLAKRSEFFFFFLGSGLCQSMSRLSLTDQRQFTFTPREIEAIGAALIDPSRGTTCALSKCDSRFATLESFCLVSLDEVH
jgi:hypothetical protein